MNTADDRNILTAALCVIFWAAVICVLTLTTGCGAPGDAAAELSDGERAVECGWLQGPAVTLPPGQCWAFAASDTTAVTPDGVRACDVRPGAATFQAGALVQFWSKVSGCGSECSPLAKEVPCPNE